MITAPCELERVTQSGTRKIQVNALRIARVENPTNLGGYGGATIGRNPVRVFFIDNHMEVFSAEAFRILAELPGFIQTQNDTSAILLNAANINYIAEDTSNPVATGEWFAYMAGGTRVPVDGPGVIKEPERDDENSRQKKPQAKDDNKRQR
jgi:hypothetical protein